MIDKNLIKLLHNKSLSGRDIHNFLGGQCNILTYPEIKEFNSIDNILSIDKPLVLLYMTKEHYGHWVCLIKHLNKIEFFDSYGTVIDKQLDKINPFFRSQSGQDYPYLLKLLYDSGLPVEYNHYPIQKKYKDKIETVATCGRHCIVRLLNKDLELENYINGLKNVAYELGGDEDDIVVLITENI